MLQLLLDEYISPDVAEGLRRRDKSAVVHTLQSWEGGNFLGQDDAVILREASTQKLTLVTYDRRTIPPLLKLWAESGKSHAGVVFIDDKTISPADVGALVRALIPLSAESSSWDWTDRVCFLRR